MIFDENENEEINILKNEEKMLFQLSKWIRNWSKTFFLQARVNWIGLGFSLVRSMLVNQRSESKRSWIYFLIQRWKNLIQFLTVMIERLLMSYHMDIKL